VNPVDGETSIDLASFRLAATTDRVIPVSRTLLADGLSAVGLFEALCGSRAGTFLLESAEAGRSWSRYSFIGVRAAAMLAEEDGRARWFGRVPVGLPTDGSAWEVLTESARVLHTPLEDSKGGPRLTSGFVGYLSYDAVRNFEKLPDANRPVVDLPEMGFLLATDLAVLDHFRGTVTLIANAINFDASDERVDEAWQDACARLDRMEADLSAQRVLTATKVPTIDAPEVHSHTSEADYLSAVATAKDYIAAGDAFQIVLSQRYSLPTAADGLAVYRVLRSANPSPYMYLIRMPGTVADHDEVLSEEIAVEIVGSSPEALVTVRDRQCTVHPIAGTRPRGADPAADHAMAQELLADEKERAEHVMLVDLARNDLGRVCAPGSVDVTEFMEIERYSHVMHIVSTVVGRLRDDASALDALRATFPAGTLSGAPKVRAMEIIDELEPTRRGLYGGVVGYVDFSGNVDVAIAIRTAVIQDGIAHVQAGAGIVADSDPAAEARECASKAGAVVRAVATADAMSRSGGHPSNWAAS
jgi:anthranilate synthase component 1